MLPVRISRELLHFRWSYFALQTQLYFKKIQNRLERLVDRVTENRAASYPKMFQPSSKEEVRSTQLHNFSNASQSGYGAVSYLRFEDAKGDIHCSFVMAKSMVAPLKATTIPRIELAAAVVATRLDQMVRSESDIRINSSIF